MLTSFVSFLQYQMFHGTKVKFDIGFVVLLIKTWDEMKLV